jgi:hypothetical protein
MQFQAMNAPTLKVKLEVDGKTVVVQAVHGMIKDLPANVEAALVLAIQNQVHLSSQLRIMPEAVARKPIMPERNSDPAANLMAATRPDALPPQVKDTVVPIDAPKVKAPADDTPHVGALAAFLSENPK